MPDGWRRDTKRVAYAQNEASRRHAHDLPFNDWTRLLNPPNLGFACAAPVTAGPENPIRVSLLTLAWCFA